MARVLLLAARQPELAELLEDAGYEVELRTRPLDGAPEARRHVPAIKSRGVRGEEPSRPEEAGHWWPTDGPLARTRWPGQPTPPGGRILDYRGFWQPGR